MNETAFIDLLQNAVWLVILLSAPLLVINLAVGLAISIFQAVTQIQEATLTFVPKMLATLLVLVLTGPWMTRMVLDYSVRLFQRMVELGHPVIK